MKKYIYRILFFLMPYLMILGSTSCSDDDNDGLDLSKGVTISSFKANGIEGMIDESKKPSTIKLYMPWSADLKSLTISVQASEGATVTPSISEKEDLSSAKTYRVTNGNLYNDYVVSASYSKFTSFTIGAYNGVIDEANQTITVKYPIGEDVTSLKPTFTVTPEAIATPESKVNQDFTDPVVYKLSYMGESVDYTVTVVPTNFSPVGFLGTAESASDIENEDEKTAYEWFIKSIPNAQYVSFASIKDGTASLSDFSVLWWHLDGASRDLPTVATSSAVLTPIKSYFENGGSLFLSSWAVRYAPIMGATKDNKEANNMWGESNAEDAVTVSEDWGLCFTGHENHPIFAGLSKPAGVNNKVFLLGSGIKVKAHNALWNFAEDWVDYKSKQAWQEASGSIGLASFQWDNDNQSRAVMFEYPKTETKGGVVCIGSEAYDWSVVGTNTNRGNLELLTTNIIEYLQN